MPGVGVGGAVLLLVLALLAAYFNAQADFEAKKAEVRQDAAPPAPLPPVSAEVQKPPVAQTPPSTVEAKPSSSPVVTTPVADLPASAPAAPKPEVPVTVPVTAPVVEAAPVQVNQPDTPKPTVAAPVAAPAPVTKDTQAATPPSPVATPKPEGLTVAAEIPSRRGLLLPALVMVLFFVLGAVNALVLVSMRGPQHAPPADAGVLFAAAVAKLPRTRLPVVQEPAPSVALRKAPVAASAPLSQSSSGSSSAVKASTSGSNPSLTSAAFSPPSISISSPLPSPTTVTSVASPTPSAAAKERSSKATSVSPAPSVVSTPPPASVTPPPVATPASTIREIPLPPSHTPPPPPIEAQAAPGAVVRSDLALSSSRLMMGLVGKSTPTKEKEPSNPRLEEPTTPKTWKWKEAEAKRREELARSKQENAAKEASGEVHAAPAPAAALVSSPSKESVVVSAPQAPHLVDPNDSEDGLRKEEARLARSLSKKGINLRPGV